jgi:hypothetical protein
VLTTALLLSALSAMPAERFALDHPGSARAASSDGTRLLHASGLSVAARGAGPAGSARAFLAAEGAAFGLAAGHELLLRGAPPAGRAGAVRFERRIQGLPVFGGDLVVGVDAQGRIRAVNAGDVPGAASGSHAIGEQAAVAAALAAFPGGARGAGPARVTAGWRGLVGQLRAAYQVDFVASDPAGDWRVYVDGATSAPLFRESLRFQASAPGSVYQVSPAESLTSVCPLGANGAHAVCFSPVAVTLPNLSTGASLSGTQTAVFNCRGGDASAASPCLAVPAVSGGFSFAPDTTWLSITDDFAAVMAYYHLDRHATFLKSIDPTLPGGTLRALNGSLPGLVNYREAGNPVDNAFYSGAADAMVFGQGTFADFAYDASVMYHELTHGVVQAWGGFATHTDQLGALEEPGAVNEGTADALAVSETGHSLIGAFPFAFGSAPAPFLRDMDDPAVVRTCKGNGTVVPQFGITAINGLDGEVHDDGEIWNGFFWEVFRGLEGAGIRGCGGACPAGAALQYQALHLAGGTSPTLATYWLSFKTAATNLFPGKPEVATYVDCVARRRGMDQCDRTVPVYQGETKLQFVRQRYSPFQMVVEVPGTSAGLTICSDRGTATTIHGRVGAPVGLTFNTPGSTDATFVEDGSEPFTQPCSGGTHTFTLDSTTPGAVWYLLFDSPTALGGASPGFDVYKVEVVSGGQARPFSPAPPTCSIAAGFIVAQSGVTVAPRGSFPFSASGGSGAITWSMAANPSGGTVDPSTGSYTAGVAGGVTDVVRATDGTGATATSAVTVGPGVTVAPASASVVTGATQALIAAGGNGGPYTWSFQANRSGATLSAAGLYTAGATTGLTDVVQAFDSLGNQGTASLAVVVQPPAGGGGSKGGGCSTGGDGTLALALGLLALLGARPSRRRR